MQTKHIVLAGLLVAMSTVLAFTKITSSIAFDFMPAIFAGVFFKKDFSRLKASIIAGSIALLGYIITSATSGFPFGADITIIVAISMFLAGFSFSIIEVRGNYLMLGLAALAALGFNLISLVYLGITVSFAVSATLVLPITLACSGSIIIGYLLGLRFEKLEF